MKILKNLQPTTYNLQHKKGFTLVELLLFMAIYSTLLVVLTTLFTSIMDVKLRTEATSAVQDDGNYILLRLMYAATQATDITSPTTLGTNATSLQLDMSGVNNTYTINQNNLVVTDDSGSHNLNSFGTTVSDLNIVRLGNSSGKNSLRISFTLTSAVVNNGIREIKNFQTTVGTR